MKQTPAQKKTSEIVAGFSKILGDQQLVSGVAILSAGLASRCKTSLYEFNIVTCMAYLCTYTHLLSLAIQRDYLYRHSFVRFGRVILTIGFFVLFCFAYTVNTATYDSNFGEDSSLNMGNVFQCIFEAHRFDKSVRFSAWYAATLLGVLAYQHAIAIADLFVHPESDTPNLIVEGIIARSLRKTGMSREDCREVAANSSVKYEAWLRPSEKAGKDTKISTWYHLETYFNTALSMIPGILAGISYGTVSSARAVWDSDFDISGLDEFGFGQVVALTMLALMLLAAAEVVNGKQPEVDKTEKTVSDSITHQSRRSSRKEQVQHKTNGHHRNWN